MKELNFVGSPDISKLEYTLSQIMRARGVDVKVQIRRTGVNEKCERLEGTWPEVAQ